MTNMENKQTIGHIAQVLGAVVDVKFDNVDDLPNILASPAEDLIL